MTYSADTLNKMAELVLDRLQVTSSDVAKHVGLSIQATEDGLRVLQRQGRVHRVHQTIPLSATGSIWAPGRCMKVDGHPVFEPVHLTVHDWKPALFRTSELESLFFGRTSASAGAMAEARP